MAEVQIGFRGTPEYRRKLQKLALEHGLKVQGLIELALDRYLRDKAAEVGAIVTDRFMEPGELADDENADWPSDVPDGDELMSEFEAMLKHPGPHDRMGKGGMRQHIIDHLRHPGFREERRKAKGGEKGQ